MAAPQVALAQLNIARVGSMTRPEIRWRGPEFAAILLSDDRRNGGHAQKGRGHPRSLIRRRFPHRRPYLPSSGSVGTMPPRVILRQTLAQLPGCSEHALEMRPLPSHVVMAPRPRSSIVLGSGTFCTGGGG